jgi:hypothetical protein
MTKNKTTPYLSKAKILADLWLHYRKDEDFIDFIEMNDIGLPLAYAISEGIVKSSTSAEKYLNESFELLTTVLDIDDIGFETLDDLLTCAADQESSE